MAVKLTHGGTKGSWLERLQKKNKTTQNTSPKEINLKSNVLMEKINNVIQVCEVSDNTKNLKSEKYLQIRDDNNINDEDKSCTQQINMLLNRRREMKNIQKCNETQKMKQNQLLQKKKLNDNKKKNGEKITNTIFTILSTPNKKTKELVPKQFKELISKNTGISTSCVENKENIIIEENKLPEVELQDNKITDQTNQQETIKISDSELSQNQDPILTQNAETISQVTFKPIYSNKYYKLFRTSRLDCTEFSIEKIPDPLVYQSFAKDLILFVEEDEEQEDEGKKNCKEEGKEQDVKA